jgi:hypothetical protein
VRRCTDPHLVNVPAVLDRVIAYNPQRREASAHDRVPAHHVMGAVVRRAQVEEPAWP